MRGAGIPKAALVVGLLAGAGPAMARQAPVAAPASFSVADRTVLLVVHAQGAQVYECRTDAQGRTAWALREPIATLVSDGKTIGRHYLGPTWELNDGEVIQGKAAASAPGATPADAPLLKLDVAARRGDGVLKTATLVLRLNTHGGALDGPCDSAGTLRAQAYSADYAFLR